MSYIERFDPDKAVEVLLYISSSCQNMYNALKVLYFADKDHLSKYGRLICGDRYISMSRGPVPSGVYDLVKYARGDGVWRIDFPIDEILHVDGYNLIPTREANLNLFSETDIECIDIALKKYGHLSFNELQRISHDDEAFNSADQNDIMSLESIINTLPNSSLLLDYINDR